MKPVYLDHNATTPIDPRVADEIHEALLGYSGNPSSPHSLGRAARKRLEAAREKTAALLGAEPAEIVFTSGGTESDNLAVIGGARARAERGRHVVITEVEHPAVLGAGDVLEAEGYEVTRLPVDGRGLLTVDDFAAALREDTVLASVMLANNETGALLDVAGMAAAARDRGVLFHTDAVQAVGKVPVRVPELGVDLLTVASHKFQGPKGIGILYVRPGTPLEPMLFGGHQESGLRPGTSLVALAAGFARALELAVEELEDRAAHLRAVTDRLRRGLMERIPGVRLNGPEEERLPNTLNVSFEGVAGEALLIALDREGFCVATGSACASGSALPSHVLTAMGLPKPVISSSLRLSTGPETTEEEIDRFLDVAPAVVARLREVSGGGPGN